MYFIALNKLSVRVLKSFTLFIFLVLFQDIDCHVESRDISFAVFASQQTHEGVKLTNLTVHVLKLRGHVSFLMKLAHENNNSNTCKSISF